MTSLDFVAKDRGVHFIVGFQKVKIPYIYSIGPKAHVCIQESSCVESRSLRLSTFFSPLRGDDQKWKLHIPSRLPYFVRTVTCGLKCFDRVTLSSFLQVSFSCFLLVKTCDRSLNVRFSYRYFLSPVKQVVFAESTLLDDSSV